MARAEEIASTSGIDYKASHGLSLVYLPTGDRQLEFGGVKKPDDWRKWRGRAQVRNTAALLPGAIRRYCVASRSS
jgi:hypothetical protein